MEILKMVLDQSAGVAIAILLIWRIEGKLDSLTNAVTKLTDAISASHKSSI